MLTSVWSREGTNFRAPREDILSTQWDIHLRWPLKSMVSGQPGALTSLSRPADKLKNGISVSIPPYAVVIWKGKIQHRSLSKNQNSLSTETEYGVWCWCDHLLLAEGSALAPTHFEFCLRRAIHCLSCRSTPLQEMMDFTKAFEVAFSLKLSRVSSISRWCVHVWILVTFVCCLEIFASGVSSFSL